MTQLTKLFDLTGRVALISGGSRGLGFQIAEALGEYGAKVALVARKQHELDEAVAKLAEQGIEAKAIAADLLDPANAPDVCKQAMDAFGRMDVLVNSAGATWGAKAEDYPLDGWNKVIGLSLSSIFHLTQAAANAAFLPQGKGAVLNVASVAAYVGHLPNRPGTVAYNAAKGGVVSMTRALAAEWGPRNIRVNSLAPGFFPSRMTDGTLAEYGKEIVEQTPLGRLGGDDDLKGAALLLSGDAGAHITGQTLIVDGGATII
ncbi:SDR family oxidoreductase [Alteraurantiacibacter aquimixticola]|uniref:SDR family oxidoreductase n=1 Tax=Alteraurantiacibacter aquimixticola TaxID=2489173 RepID=A0A4T3F372_9SPHN|nr:SDR family oxidoreductase [Alteraurantiacibacter aquimixticola]TIX51715.1 SDR family oxidoreductase [Alteraurantiacibacter aquimixticola]